MKEKKMKEKNSFVFKKKAAEQSILLIFIIVVASILLVFGFLVSARIDLTKNNVYSISKTSRELIKDIKDPVYVDYYISPTLEVQDSRPQQIEDLLTEYSVRSNGKIVYTKKDASKPKSQEEIESNKLEGQQIQILKQDQASFALVYSGIVISYQDKSKVIPFVLDPVNIEYQLTSKILEVYTNDEKKVGILVLDNDLRVDSDYKTFQQVIQQDAKVQILVPHVPIMDDIDSLFVIGGKDIDEETAYYIDQFIMSGKGVFFAVDRARVVLQQGIDVSLQDNLLLQMLEKYGVKVGASIVADEQNKLIPISRGNFNQLSPYALWISASSREANQDHPLTANFSGMDSYWTSPLEFIKEGEEFVPLIYSSEKAWVLPPISAPSPSTDSEGNTSEEEVKIFRAMPDPTNFQSYKTAENTKRYKVIVAVQGKIDSAVENGLIQKVNDASINYKSNTDSGRIIVAGNINFFSELYRAGNSGYNFEFMSNASDWLATSDKILSIKARKGRNIQLDKIQGDKFIRVANIVKIIDMIVIPLIIIIVAIVLLTKRKSLSVKKYKLVEK